MAKNPSIMILFILVFISNLRNCLNPSLSLIFKASTIPVSETQSRFVKWINELFSESIPSPYSFLNEYLIQSLHLDIGKDLIRINLMDTLESNHAFVSDWVLIVGKGDNAIGKAYKNLRHWRRDAEISPSRVTPGFSTRSEIWAPINHSTAGKLPTS